MLTSSKFELVLGLEVHIELSTLTKMFCACLADHFAKKPNTQVCPICLGLPGAMPFANKKAIDSVIKFGLSLGCKIANFSKFDRKHYFYPDLPKGYQISQYDLPFCTQGKGYIEGKKIGIRRVHLEEDTGKLQHNIIGEKKVSLIDFNRSGVPLMELVTEPDFNSVRDALMFLKEIQRIVRYLDISQADMEKGSMRLEANVSVFERSQKQGKLPDYKVEIKNINSFKFLEKAVLYEFSRQSQLLEKGEKVVQETRGFDERLLKTVPQRLKEEANDYRYFPEPDIPPIEISKKEIETLKDNLPELPSEKRLKYEELGVHQNYIEVLIDDPNRAKYFENAQKVAKKHNVSASTIAAAMVNRKEDFKFEEPQGLVLHLVKLTQKTFSSEQETSKAVDEVLSQEREAVQKYKRGKIQVLGYIIGQVQKKLKGKGKADLIREIFVTKLRG